MPLTSKHQDRGGPVRARARVLGLVLGLFLAIAPGAGVARADARSDRAMALFHEARKAYEHGEYRAAIVKLEAAIQLDPEGKELVYNLGLVHEKLGDIEDSQIAFQHYLTMEPDPKQRERVQGILKRLDGAKRDMDAHQEQQRAESASAAPPSAIAPSPSSDPEHSRRSPWVFAFGGTAAGALVVGAAFAVSAVALKPGSSATTGAGVTYTDLEDDAQSAHRHAILADISFAIAALAGGAAVFLELSGRGAKASSATSTSVAFARFVPGPGGFEVRF